jgi:hypothetical protein
VSNLYVVPLVQTTLPGLTDSSGNPIEVSVPEYSVNASDPLYGATYVSMPLIGASLSLIATAPNAALAAESDVFAFPADLTPAMSDTDIDALTAVLENANVPTTFLVPGVTYEAAAQTIGAIAQVLQQASGAGTPITLGSQSPSQGKGKTGGSAGGSSTQNAALLASAAAWTTPIILSTGEEGAL